MERRALQIRIGQPTYLHCNVLKGISINLFVDSSGILANNRLTSAFVKCQARRQRVEPVVTHWSLRALRMLDYRKNVIHTIPCPPIIPEFDLALFIFY